MGCCVKAFTIAVVIGLIISMIAFSTPGGIKQCFACMTFSKLDVLYKHIYTFHA